ncbi:spermidine synthase [Quadrisphaera sp. INWT6]|uniref:spermidine synthase n=1 Tax=Quadrisphaera sp. INWT6 TaxID=2596917 RepID=UPI0018924D0B|nr:fused MFS/spermidine synthase [Quadrisphaera sp. INWT6]
MPPSRGQRRNSRPTAGPPPPEGRFATTTGQVEWVRERDDGAWTLYVNGVPSSPLRAGAPEVLDFEYLQWMADCVRLALPAEGGAPLRAVHLGGGACALPRHLAAVRAGAGGTRQVVVELDAELVARVREWVDLPRSPELRIQAGDARAGLAARRDASADLVVRDVFAGDSTPRHVVTAEFTAEVARVLDPSRGGGLYLANAVDRTSPVGLKAEVATLLAVFPHVAAALEPGVLRGRRHGNAVLLASHAPLPLAELTRALGAGAAVARVLHGDALTALVAGAAVVHDPV